MQYPLFVWWMSAKLAVVLKINDMSDLMSSYWMVVKHPQNTENISVAAKALFYAQNLSKFPYLYVIKVVGTTRIFLFIFFIVILHLVVVDTSRNYSFFSKSYCSNPSEVINSPSELENSIDLLRNEFLHDPYQVTRYI